MDSCCEIFLEEPTHYRQASGRPTPGPDPVAWHCGLVCKFKKIFLYTALASWLWLQTLHYLSERILTVLAWNMDLLAFVCWYCIVRMNNLLAASESASACHKILFCFMYNQEHMYFLVYLLYIFFLAKRAFSPYYQSRLNVVHDTIPIKIGLHKIKFIGSHN